VRLVLKRFRSKFDIAVTALLMNPTTLQMLTASGANAYLTGHRLLQPQKYFICKLKVFTYKQKLFT